MATTIGNLITLDGGFTDWPSIDTVEKPENAVANYQIYGALVDDATLGKNQEESRLSKFPDVSRAYLYQKASPLD